MLRDIIKAELCDICDRKGDCLLEPIILYFKEHEDEVNELDALLTKADGFVDSLNTYADCQRNVIGILAGFALAHGLDPTLLELPKISEERFIQILIEEGMTPTQAKEHYDAMPKDWNPTEQNIRKAARSASILREVIDGIEEISHMEGRNVDLN